MYLDLINEALNEFLGEWNNHPITTETNFSPQQLWVRGMVLVSDSQSMAVQDVVQPSNYGIDEVGPVLQEEDYRIVVPQSPVSLCADQVQHVQNAIQASRDDSGNGITSSVVALNTVNFFS